MRKKHKKTALRAVFAYLLLTCGIWMFIKAYSNSCSRLERERTISAGITINGSSASVTILDHSQDIDLSLLNADSRLYYVLYLISPDEVRIVSPLLTQLTSLFSAA